MGIRDLLVLAAVYGSIPAILVRPFFGLLVFSWLAYMRPQDIAWGIQPYRLSLVVALATAAGLLFKFGKERLVAIRLQTLLITALWLWFALATQFAVLPEPSKAWFSLFSKIILIALLTTGIVQTESRLRLQVIVIAFSLGALGLKYGVYGVLRGGVELYAGPGGFLSDRNDLALAMAMAIPLLVAIYMVESNRRLKAVAVALAGGCILTIAFTFSRGGFLTLAVIGLVLMLRTRRFKEALAAAAILLVLFAFASEGFKTRLLGRAESIKTYEQDASATGRLDAWIVALKMSAEYPLLGVGPENFATLAPRFGGYTWRVAHNTYLQVLAECGIPALLLYMSILVVTLWRLERLIRAPGTPWVSALAVGIQTSLIGFMTGGFFLNRAYFDLVYHLVAITVSLEIVASQSPESLANSTSGGKTPDSDSDWWLEPPSPEPLPENAAESR